MAHESAPGSSATLQLGAEPTSNPGSSRSVTRRTVQSTTDDSSLKSVIQGLNNVSALKDFMQSRTSDLRNTVTNPDDQRRCGECYCQLIKKVRNLCHSKEDKKNVLQHINDEMQWLLSESQNNKITLSLMTVSALASDLSAICRFLRPRPALCHPLMQLVVYVVTPSDFEERLENEGRYKIQRISMFIQSLAKLREAGETLDNKDALKQLLLAVANA
ncbi:hypothetical protein, partial [Kistimonas scapharcae]|uniref:hypothetical protein n=1 Tax=Kistimonas scapharcae TaxID=1036133 RepID=UPI0031E787DC